MEEEIYAVFWSKKEDFQTQIWYGNGEGQSRMVF